MIETIKNYDYKTKYNQTIEQIADISKDSKILNTINKAWNSIFIQTDANQLENISFNIRYTKATIRLNIEKPIPANSAILIPTFV